MSQRDHDHAQSAQRRAARCCVALLALPCPRAGLPASRPAAPLEEIVVTARRQPASSASRRAASEGIVLAIQLEVRPILRPGEVLEVVPGLIVTQHSGSGKSNQMFLRGFNLDHGTDFATWIDGMPINMPTHGHGQGYTDLNFIIPELVRTLEFKKGPYYAEVSDFSSAGAASLSTFRHLDQGMVKGGIGRTAICAAWWPTACRSGRVALLFGVQAHAYDGPWDGVDENLERYNGLLTYSGSGPADSEWHVTMMGYDANWDSADQVPRRAVRAGLVDSLGTIDDTLGGDSSRYSLSGGWHRDFDNSHVRVRAYAIDYELDLYSNFTYFLDDPVNGDQFEQVDNRNVYGGARIWRSMPVPMRVTRWAWRSATTTSAKSGSTARSSRCACPPCARTRSSR